MSLLVLLLCAAGLLAGSSVKGIVGIGLPLVAVPLLTLVVDLRTAVALMTVPIIVSNGAQSFQGGRFVPMAKRFWLLLLPLFISILLSVRLLVVVPEKLLDWVIGCAVIAFPILVRLVPRLRVDRAHERWLNPIVGIVGGVLGGISSFYGPPIMLYVYGMRMPKDDFIPGISLMYSVAGSGLLIGIYLMGVASPHEIGLSTLMLIPTGLGMWLGRYVHVHLSEHKFQLVLTAVYAATGLSFLLHAVL